MDKIYYRLYRRFGVLTKVQITEESYNLHWDRVYSNLNSKPVDPEVYKDITSYCISIEKEPDTSKMKKTLSQNSHYYITGVFCPECGKPIYQEMTSEGKLVNNFSCLYEGSEGCNYTEKPENVENIIKKSKLSKNKGVVPKVLEVDMLQLEKKVEDYHSKNSGKGTYGGYDSPDEANFNGV